MARFLIATDAWEPQVNGVVRTLSCLIDILRRRGHLVEVVSPGDFRTTACPTYPEIRLALATRRAVSKRIERFQPDRIHIATEGPIGMAARRVALDGRRDFTTSFHTRFPEYLRQRAPVPVSWSYAYLRRFHRPATACLVPTETMRKTLDQRGFRNTIAWTRGTDRLLFRPRDPLPLDLPGPVFLTVSRLAPEKNLSAFLDLDLPGTKLVVGDGPSMGDLVRRYPEVHFAGMQNGEALARYYSSADVFVFPSRTDTFGIVLIEAIACGVPFAAYPEPGPIEVLGDSNAGAISEDLRQACLKALELKRSDALDRADAFTWDACADIFLQASERTDRSGVSGPVGAERRSPHSASHGRQRSVADPTSYDAVNSQMTTCLNQTRNRRRPHD